MEPPPPRPARAAAAGGQLRPSAAVPSPVSGPLCPTAALRPDSTPCRPRTEMEPPPPLPASATAVGGQLRPSGAFHGPARGLPPPTAPPTTPRPDSTPCSAGPLSLSQMEPPPPLAASTAAAGGHRRPSTAVPGPACGPPPPTAPTTAPRPQLRPPTAPCPSETPRPGMGGPATAPSEQQRREWRPPQVAPSCPASAPAPDIAVPSWAPPKSGFMDLLSTMGGFGSGVTGVAATGPSVPVQDAPAVVSPAIAVVPSAAIQDDGCTTPTKNSILQTLYSSFVPHCKDEFKPVVGMTFDSVKAVEDFYKTYAHEAGFVVRLGGHTKLGDRIENKRFYCARQGFINQQTDIVPSDKKKRKQKMHSETRCGCNAHIYVKLGPDNKYYIASLVEQHNHGLVSPDKIPFLSSNRSISQRVKNNLFTCHKASVGTSQAFRLLQVSDGFENIGCMKRDVQNYYRGLREKIKNADAQIFVAQMERKREANPAFFYDFVVDDEGKLIYIFWADATSRKNYSHFGDVVSFDATYSTNQYNMKFAPFTGINHHMQSVFLGGAFIVNEKIESYEWLFKTFLKAMGWKAPKLIITDEDASMKVAIRSCFPGTLHRFCMWHIMEKMPEKVGHPTNKDEQFWADLNECVWGSETEQEFEQRWNDIIGAYGLQGNEWLANRYEIRESWIPAYFMDVPLAGLLRTTSRSESSNSFFNRFIHRKLSFVEFWLRFDTALECQRHEELKADMVSIHSTPQLSTPWPMEKQIGILYTRHVFRIFQKEVEAARDHCFVHQIVPLEGIKIVLINDGSMRDRVVQWSESMKFATCTCKLFERMGIPCRHILQTLRGEKLSGLPAAYILKRWETRCKREKQFDDEGTLLEEKPLDATEAGRRKKIAAVRNKLEDLIQRAKNSSEGIDFLETSVMNIEAALSQIVPNTVQPTQEEEYEGFIGCKIPDQVQIHPPTDVRSKGRCKRIKRAKELPKQRKSKNVTTVGKEPPH